MKILVTGAAGFIGYHVAERLLARGDEVLGLDNLNTYYSVALKRARLARLTASPRFHFDELDLTDRAGMEKLFEAHRFDRVVHLAAQAGVRYSLSNPHAYVQSNLVGFLNVIEGCRHQRVEHLVFASSSSVYGANTRLPFSVRHGADHPLSLYGATKKANEVMAHSYSHLYGLPTTGLRFFTVYGPWGRPDMTPILFADAITKGLPITVYDNGAVERDFTYVSDIVDGIEGVLQRPAAPDPSWNSASPDPGRSVAPYRLFNIGSHSPVGLMHFIRLLEQGLGKKASITSSPLPATDMRATYADVDDLAAETGFAPKVSVEEGVERFLQWFKRDYMAL
jgi:UDP-glucuronate 4-epimerase